MFPSCRGLYNKHLGDGLNKIMIRHQEMLQDRVKDELELDLIETIKNNEPSVLWFDDTFTAPIHGYENREDYYRKAKLDALALAWVRIGLHLYTI